MLVDPDLGVDRSRDEDEISISELYHENSKQWRHDLAFSRRIQYINTNPGIHRIISHAFKRYSAAPVVSLPAVEPKDGPPFDQVVVQRRSVRDFTGEPLDQTEIAKLLYFGNGITSILEPSDHYTAQPVRAAPSGGALYPIELYTAITAAEGLTPGIYHYNVADHTLERLKDKDCVQVLSMATFQESIFSKASITIVLTAMFGRTRFKYGERGYRFALFEAGHVTQNILLTATAMSLGAVAVGGFIDDEINEMLDIDGVDEAAIYMVAIGRPVQPAERVLAETQSMVDILLEVLWKDDTTWENSANSQPIGDSSV